MRIFVTAIALLSASSALAQNPDPAWMLGRQPGPPPALMSAGDRCYLMGYRREAWRRCTVALQAMPRRAPLYAPLPGVMCDTIKMDEDYAITDCF